MGEAGVLQPLLYLQLTQARNRVMGVVRNLYKPGYFLGIALMVLLLAIMLSGRSRPFTPAPQGMHEFFEFMAGSMVTLMWYLAWLMPASSPSLLFSEAEIAFLFPAPLSRRQLIHYKLLASTALAMAFSLIPAVCLTLPNPQAGFTDFLKLLLVIMCISLVNVYQSAIANLLQSSAVEHGHGGRFRGAVIGVGLVVVVMAFWLSSMGSVGTLFKWLPGRLLVHTGFADGLDYTLSQYLLFVVVALHYWWVLHLDSPFEEHAMALAARRAAMMAGKTAEVSRPVIRREPFRLGDGAPIELVLLWKNLLTIPAYLNRRVWGMAMLATALMMELLPRAGGEVGPLVARTLGGAAMVSLMMLMAFAPTLSGVGIGTELTRADLVKAWPVPGWRIVLGSLLMPLVVMTAVVWLLLLAIGLSPPPPRSNGMAAVVSSGSLVLSIAALVLPAILSMQLVLGFIPPLVFPQWVKPGAATRGGGLDLLGTGLLMTTGVSVLLLVALVPPSLVALVVFYYGLWLQASGVVVLLSAGAAIVVLVLEVMFVVHLLGERFEKMDIAADLRM